MNNPTYEDGLKVYARKIEKQELRIAEVIKERDQVAARRNELVEKYENLRAKCQSEGTFVSPYAGIQEMKITAEESESDAHKGMIWAIIFAVMAIVALVVILAMTLCTESDVPEVVDQFNQETGGI